MKMHGRNCEYRLQLITFLKVLEIKVTSEAEKLYAKILSSFCGLVFKIYSANFGNLSNVFKHNVTEFRQNLVKIFGRQFYLTLY